MLEVSTTLPSRPICWYFHFAGFGTLEELLEVITWQQLGYHAKPVVSQRMN